MSLQSTLNGCYDALRESAKQHRLRGDAGHASMCDLQADGVLKYIGTGWRPFKLADLDKEQEEETSDGPA